MNVLELFAGFGGACFALKKANVPHKIVGISEIDKKALLFYQKNHDKIINYGDIKDINPNELPKIDLVTGGFPCQDVSLSGLRDLSRGRTNLFFEIIRIMKVCMPRYVLLENVQGILNHAKGETLRKILNELNKTGYIVKYKLLHSYDYNNIQLRPRVWFCCFKHQEDANKFTFPAKKSCSKKLLFENKVLKNLGEKDISKYHIFFLELLKKKINIGSINNIFAFTYRYDEGVRIYKNYKIPTFTKNINKNDKSNTIFIYKDGKIYELNNKIAWKLMGLNYDNLNLEGLSVSDQLSLCGNGWDVDVASLIFKNMFFENINLNNYLSNKKRGVA